MALNLEFVAKHVGFDKVKAKAKSVFDSIKSQGGGKGVLSGLFGSAAGTNILLALGIAGKVFNSMLNTARNLFRVTVNLAAQLDQMAKSARRTGMSFQEFQKMSFAAALTGATPENVERAIRKFQKMYGDMFMNPKGRPAQALGLLGMTKEDLKGMSEFERFLKVMEAINRVKDRGMRSSLAQEMFGRGGTQLLPSGAAMKEAQTIFKNLNLGISDEALKAGEEFGDQMKILERQVVAFASQSGLLDGFITAFRIMNVLVNDLRTILANIELPSWLTDIDKLVKILSGMGGKGAVAGGVLKYFADVAKRSEELIPARADQPKGTVGLDEMFSKQLSFQQMRSNFNNFGGFATAGLRTSGMNNPMQEALDRHTYWLETIADILKNPAVVRHMDRTITNRTSYNTVYNAGSR